MSDYELSRRLRAVERGKDPQESYSQACEALRQAHRAFNASKTKAGQTSFSAQENYARALREVDLCARILQITQFEKSA